MRSKWLVLSFLTFAVIGGIFVGVKYYSLIFARKVVGEIMAIEKVAENVPQESQGESVPPAEQTYTAVAIRAYDGEIFTSRGQNGEWAVAQKGQCAEVKFYPFPPWDLENSGNFQKAQLKRLFDCPGAQRQ